MATRPPRNPYAAAAAPVPAPRRRRGWRIAAWTLAALLALVALVLGAAWWWAGGQASLATTLDRAARYLPADQQLETRDVTGSLRAGGHIGWLRWSSPTLAVEVNDARIAWQLAPLLQRQLTLGEVHAVEVKIIPQGPPRTEPETPPQPLQSLELPLRIDLPFRVDSITWAAPSPVTAQGLAGHYRYDGTHHRLALDSVAFAQGHYSGQATVQAQAPMALELKADGTVRTASPGGGDDIEAKAHAEAKGTLATAAARLQITAQLQAQAAEPLTVASPAAGTSRPGPAPSAKPTKPSKPAARPAAPAEPMRADVQAEIAPWAAQPVLQARADVESLDLAALWPQAPVTSLSGQLRVDPAAAAAPGATAAGWAIGAQLRNAVPGPWDQRRLPLESIDAQAAFDGTQWTVPDATARIGNGSVALQGRFTPATRAMEGRAEVRGLRPSALYSTLDSTPVAGQAQARSEGGDGEPLVRFSADLRATGTAAPRRAGAPAALRVERLATEGTWQGSRLALARLQLDALQAQVNARQLQIGTADLSVKGQLQATVPGATAQMDGQIAPRAGNGQLELRVADAQRVQRWIESLPGLATALRGASMQGDAQLTTRWNGGWQTLQRQLQAAGLLAPAAAGTARAAAGERFEWQARLAAPRFDVSLPASGSAAPMAVRLTAVRAELAGGLPQSTLLLDGEARVDRRRLDLRLRGTAGTAAPGQWNAQITELRAQARDDQLPGPWTVQFNQPLSVALRQSPSLQVETSGGQATVSGPAPGQVTLHWEPVRFAQAANGAIALRTQGRLQGLPMAWTEAFGPQGQEALQRLGLAGNLVFDGDWDVDAGDTLRASASVRRVSGDIRVLAGSAAPTTTVVHSSGQGQGTGRAQTSEGPGTPAGVRQAEVQLQAEGDTVRARVQWDSERAGRVQAEGSTRLARADGGWQWPADAPLAATVRAQLPDVGVWSALAPPGWRVKGTLDANVALAGNRAAPRWSGTLGADQLSVRSLIDGVDLQDGRLRATLNGDRLDITEFRVNGGQGSNARIAGFSGNRTAAPRDGGTLTGKGSVSWATGGSGATGSGIAMDFDAEARALQVLVRADRQVSVSGNLQARLRQGQFTLRGKLTTDRATIILPEAGAPSLGTDVVVRSAAKDRETVKQAERAGQAAGRVEAAKPPDIAVTLNLGDDFALQGHGITTRLAGELEIRGATVAGAPPRVTGEVRTVEGRYRAWGQSLDVETGLARFNGPYDNPALDILAIRPNISVRAGVQVTGSAKAPRVRLYSDPDLPDAEKLSWVVLGRSGAAGGAEAALLQQAALALLGGNGNAGAGNFAKRVGLDEIGFKGPGSGEDASAAALTFGKRLSKDLYVTYERSLSGALGTLYIFYDLTKSLTLRGQTGAQSAVDLIYTVRYD
ncbi:translocation/assembly module TamB domain-containing protein [Acidovorax sp. SUPP2539]|uniref:translocation/assembly module TamB domain-containing protein n=1 Tax=Acidovorax sp. SUPP2539 TaxID=2920878 RepID=UPI0023DE36C9|nr:translocation/assembly module TamB domain-containing protein [Acidovorax sp. SUPP2539]GKS87923.1 translocation/assembly module TamB domain-containing protein [Acidovorax sp. SUPP2539]